MTDRGWVATYHHVDAPEDEIRRLLEHVAQREGAILAGPVETAQRCGPLMEGESPHVWLSRAPVVR